MNRCAMGTEIRSDGSCPTCGADSDGTCGRWVTAAEGVLRKAAALVQRLHGDHTNLANFASVDVVELRRALQQIPEMKDALLSVKGRDSQ